MRQVSLIRRFSRWLLVAALIISISMLLGLTLLWQSRLDAQAINVAGTLRMQHYRLAYLLDSHANHAEIVGKAQALDESMLHHSLAPLLQWPTPQHLQQRYRAILADWQQLHLQLNNYHDYRLHDVEQRVNAIDALVADIQRYLDLKIAILAAVQIVALLLLSAIGGYLLWFMRRRISAPLMQLVDSAKSLQRHDFSTTIPAQLSGELAVLGESFAAMRDDLKGLYDDLQSQVAQQTAALQQANNDLALLYHCSQQAHGQHVTDELVLSLLAALQQNQQCSAASIQLTQPMIGISAQLRVGEEPHECQHDYQQLLADDHGELGTLCCCGPIRNQSLVDTFSRLLVRVLRGELARRDQQALSIQHERAVISRELHDSLAQSLSYLRIQLTLLRRQLPSHHQKIDELLLTTEQSYRYLRELLSHFRLKIDTQLLPEALNQLVSELQPQSQAPLQVCYHSQIQQLSPAVMVHTVHLVREALCNAIKHAHASRIDIDVSDRQSLLQLSVQDDGIGLQPAENSAHFGLTTMRERAHQLGGTLQIQSANPGTVIQLTFDPHRQPEAVWATNIKY